MMELIAETRTGNTKLREILSNWKLLHPNPNHDRWMLPRGSWSYSTIAQEAQFTAGNIGNLMWQRSSTLVSLSHRQGRLKLMKGKSVAL